MKWIKLLDFNSYFTTAAAAWTMAGVSAAGAAYSASEQKDAQEEQEQLQNQAAQDAKEQEQRLFEQRALDAESQGQATVEFGAIDDEEDSFGTYDDFLTPTQGKSTGLGGTNNQIGLTV